MNDDDLDRLYTRMCNVMTAVGEPRTPLFLARFALLAMDAIGDAATVEKLISQAAESLPDEAPGRAT
ncbi:MAG: hypothetical protein U1F52_00270 [Burkholderiales bacterium]